MRTILTTLFLAWIALVLVHGTVLGSRENKEDKDTYDHETTAFKQQGLCRLYKSQGVGGNKAFETCYDFCHKTQGDNSDIGCQGAVEANGNTNDIVDPDGHVFYMGKCLCEAPPIAKELAEVVIEALPAVAAIGCEILFNTFDKVLEFGTLAIPGVGELSAGMSGSVKAAKTIAENGETASGFAQWFGDPCNPDHSSDVAKYTKQIDKIFDPLSAVSDDVQAGAGCVIPDKKKCKGSKGNGDKGPDPTSKGPDPTSKGPDSTTTKDGDQPTSTGNPSSTKSDDKTTTTSWMPCDTTAADICQDDPDTCKDLDSNPDLSVNPGDASAESDSDGDPGITSRDLVERDTKRTPLYVKFASPAQNFKIESQSYPTQGELFDGEQGKQVIQKAFDFQSQDLKNLELGSKTLPSTEQRKKDNKWVTEHIVELQTMRDFIEAAVSGRLNSGALAKTAKIPQSFFTDNWNQEKFPNNVPNVGKSDRNPAPRSPNDRIFEALGSTSNRADFVLCIQGVNSVKALLWSNKNPMNRNRFERAVRQAANPDNYDSTKKNKGKSNGPSNIPDDDSKQLVSKFMSKLRDTIGVFRYLQDHDVNTRLWDIIDNVHNEMSRIETAIPAGNGLTAMWDEFIKDQLDRVEGKAKAFLRDSIQFAQDRFDDAEKQVRQKGEKTTPQYIRFTKDALAEYKDEIGKCTIPRMTVRRRWRSLK